MARASTAAIKVEKLAANNASDFSTPDARPDVRVETEAAIYEDGKVLLKGNPLKTTKEILCPRCHLPRLLYPTDGKGAQKPDPGVIYCKKHPYIEKPGYDIYGQTWVAPGPGRGKKKKDMEKKLDPNDPSSPAPLDGGSAKDRPPNVLSFPSATCSKCKRCILVTRLNNHMGSCIGNSGRNASRAAAQKISNGGSNGGSQNNDNTPPGSQKGTPLPGSRAASPRKRDVEEFDEDADESDPSNPKKKKVKPNALTKVILKTKPAAKKDKVKGSSMLNVEQKAGDDPIKLTPAPKKSTGKGPSPAKKAGKAKPTSKPAAPSPAPKKGKRERDMESESSGTLSSPPQG